MQIERSPLQSSSNREVDLLFLHQELDGRADVENHGDCHSDNAGHEVKIPVAEKCQPVVPSTDGEHIRAHDEDGQVPVSKTGGHQHRDGQQRIDCANDEHEAIHERCG